MAPERKPNTTIIPDKNGNGTKKTSAELAKIQALLNKLWFEFHKPVIRSSNNRGKKG